MKQPSAWQGEPSILSGMIQSLLQAIIVMVVSFDLITMTDTQQSSLQGVITSALTLGLAIWVRSKVTPVASLEYLTQEFRNQQDTVSTPTASTPGVKKIKKESGQGEWRVAAVAACVTIIVIVVLKVFSLI